MSDDVFDFEAWYESLHKPAPSEKFNLSEAMLKTILAQDRDTVSSICQSIARGNDIDSLKTIIKHIDKVRQAAGTNDMTGTLPLEFSDSLVYCTSHLLIDGAGHEDLARLWMKKFGHTTERAINFYEKNTVKDNGDLVGAQARLGLTTLFDPFKIHSNKANSCPAYCALFELDTASSTNKVHAQHDFAALLRKHSPDQLPIVETRNPGGTGITRKPIIELLWANSRMSPVLRAITQVYQPGAQRNPQVEKQMELALQKALAPDTSHVQITPTGNAREHWQTIMDWRTDKTAELLWNGTFSSFSQRSKTLDTRIARAASFFDAFFNAEPEDRLIIARGMHEMGQDLNDIRYQEISGQMHGRRLIDMAVAAQDSKAFGCLVALGCDPELKQLLDGSPTSSAAQVIDLASTGDWAVPTANEFAAMADFLRVWRARRNAQLALESLDKPTRRVAP